MPKNYERYLEIIGASNEEFSCECEAYEQSSFELDRNEEEGDEYE